MKMENLKNEIVSNIHERFQAGLKKCYIPSKEILFTKSFLNCTEKVDALKK